ncbi:MAG: hypothetical protein KF857_02555 [Fimbriimonadaceae bacterium]|nr:hypothetical protein [Fimbriimonadaceae bacterium]
MKVRVVRILGAATFQDAGRPGHRAHGVPPGGAFDRGSMAVANALLGQDFDLPVMEVAGPLVLECLEGGVVAMAGAPFDSRLGGEPAGLPGRAVLARRAMFSVAPGRSGARCYLAAPGGWDVEGVLGSVSGTPVEADGVYGSRGDAGRLGQATLSDPAGSLTPGPLRYIPIDDDFDWSPERPLTVSPRSDRVGVRLEGAGLTRAGLSQSEPSVWGAVQATPGGELLVHGPDGPTIGGYDKIGTVVRADLDRMAQMRPGDQVTLAAVELGEAKRILARREEELAQLVTFLKIRTISL